MGSQDATILKLFHNDEEWWVGDSLEDCPAGLDEDRSAWKEVPPEEHLELGWCSSDERLPVPGGEVMRDPPGWANPREWDVYIRARAKEWAAWNGPGHLATVA